MLRLRTFLVALALLVVPALAAADVKGPSDSDVRKSVERGLSFVEKGGVEWIQQHDCISCHNVSFMIWSHNLAASRGIRVNERVAGWSVWAAEKSLSLHGTFKLTAEAVEKLKAEGVPEGVLAKVRPVVGQEFKSQADIWRAVQKVLDVGEQSRHKAAILGQAWPPKKGGETDGGGIDTVAQLLLGRGGGADSNAMRKFVVATPALMARMQEPDGHWAAAGQLPAQNRPRAESDAVTTMWSALALGTIEKPDEATVASRNRALDAVKDVKPGGSAESLVTALLVAHRFGDPAVAIALTKRLRAGQNADGGWAWLNGGASDAFATGQALYALSVVGIAADDVSIVRGRQYLIGTQQDGGNWPVTGEGISKAATAQRKAKVKPIYEYWGTAWATIGLAESLPAGK